MTRKAVPGGRSAERSKPIQRFSINFLARRVACAAFTIIFLNYLTATGAGAASAPAAQPSPASDPSSARARVVESYARVPLTFEPNQGQSSSGVQFLSRGSGYTLFLSPGEAVLTLQWQNTSRTRFSPQWADSRPHGNATDTLRMELLRASTNATVTGLDPQPGIVNYFVGNDPTKSAYQHSDLRQGQLLRYLSRDRSRLLWQPAPTGIRLCREARWRACQNRVVHSRRPASSARGWLPGAQRTWRAGPIPGARGLSGY